jgi:membrane protease YdiL (CAAX protease family)
LGQASHHRRLMRVPRIIAVYLLTVFFTAALISPWVYQGAVYLGQHVPMFSGWGIGHGPFDRYVSGCLLAVGTVGLWPFLKTLGIRSLPALGFRLDNNSFHLWSVGLGWAIAGLIVLIGLTVGIHDRSLQLHYSLHEFARHFQKAGVTALTVSTLEEVIFRGCLFGVLRKGFPFAAAAILSAVVYAILHFVGHPPNPKIMNWNSGFVTLGKMLTDIIQWKHLIPCINLTLLGIVLAWSYEKSGSLFLPMGIHAGVIICEKTFRFVTEAIPGTRDWLWGDNKLVEGWAATAVIILIFAGLIQHFSKEPLPVKPTA